MNKRDRFLTWKPSSKKLYNHAAIEFTYPPGGPFEVQSEYALASKRGEIYPYNDEVAVILCRTAKVAKKVFAVAQVGRLTPLKLGEEIIFKVPNHLVPEAIKLLNIPVTRPAQARAANEA